MPNLQSPHGVGRADSAILHFRAERTVTRREKVRERPRQSQGQRPGLRPLRAQSPKRRGGRRGGLPPLGGGGRETGASSVLGAPPARLLCAGPGPRVQRKRARPRGSGGSGANPGPPSPARTAPLTHSPRPAAGAEGAARRQLGPAIHPAGTGAGGSAPLAAVARGRSRMRRRSALSGARPGRRRCEHSALGGGLRPGAQWVPVLPRSHQLGW